MAAMEVQTRTNHKPIIIDFDTKNRRTKGASATLPRVALQKIQILIFDDFWLGKIRKSEKNQNKNQNFARRLYCVQACSDTL